MWFEAKGFGLERENYKSPVRKAEITAFLTGLIGY